MNNNAQLVNRILERKKYKNSKLQMCIAEDYRQLIDFVATACDMDMALVINNLLSVLLDDEDFCRLLRKEAAKRHNARWREIGRGMGLDVD
jgi:hypothetical protein